MPTDRHQHYTFRTICTGSIYRWLWGCRVLPDSVARRTTCTETGARGNINFDAVGYEKMAVEAPRRTDELRARSPWGRSKSLGASTGSLMARFSRRRSPVVSAIPMTSHRPRLLGTSARLLGRRVRFLSPATTDPSAITGRARRSSSNRTWRTDRASGGESTNSLGGRDWTVAAC